MCDVLRLPSILDKSRTSRDCFLKTQATVNECSIFPFLQPSRRTNFQRSASKHPEFPLKVLNGDTSTHSLCDRNNFRTTLAPREDVGMVLKWSHKDDWPVGRKFIGRQDRRACSPNRAGGGGRGQSQEICNAWWYRRRSSIY